MRLRHFWPLAVLTTVIAGCAGNQSISSKLSARALYGQGMKALQTGNYDKAVDFFQTIEGRFPYGAYAQQAQLEIAYSYYKNGEPQSAIAAAQSYIKQYPTSSKIPYAYYLMGLADFPHPSGLSHMLRPGMAYKVQMTPLKLSFVAFKTLVRKYPNTVYAADARRRMIDLYNLMAQHQIYVAKYYVRRGAWLAVVNRCKVILKDYPRSPQVVHALRMMIQSYRHLHMGEDVKQTKAVLAATLQKTQKKSG